VLPEIPKLWSSDWPGNEVVNRSLFEASRWVASCYNDQPWFYLVADRDDRTLFDQALFCLVEFNRTWACASALLALGVYRERFAGRNELNPAAAHDLGHASALLSLHRAVRR